jgi:hypothetical protein
VRVKDRHLILDTFSGKNEFCDLKRDPGAQNNLYKKKEIKRLKRMLDALPSGNMAEFHWH